MKICMLKKQIKYYSQKNLNLTCLELSMIVRSQKEIISTKFFRSYTSFCSNDSIYTSNYNETKRWSDRRVL